MMSDYIIPLAVGILVALLFWFVFQRFYRGSWSFCRSKYDERQKAAQGTAYRNGFWTLLFAMLLWVCLENAGIPLLSTEIMIFLIWFLGLVVYVISCIMLDAYMGLNDKPVRWAILCTGIMLLNFGCAVAAYLLNRGSFWMNLLCGIMMALVLAAMAVKVLMNRRKEREEGDE